jgi:hypothetical protein
MVTLQQIKDEILARTRKVTRENCKAAFSIMMNEDTFKSLVFSEDELAWLRPQWPVRIPDILGAVLLIDESLLDNQYVIANTAPILQRWCNAE